MIAIDKLSYASGLRKKNPEVKFAYAMLSLLICVVSRSMTGAAVVLVLNGYLTVFKSGVPMRKYGKLLMIPLTFLLLSTLAIVLHIGDTPMDLFALRLGKWYLTGSRQGLQYALQLILTAMAGVSCLYFLSMTTPMTDILYVLNRLHCPRLLGEMMLLIYRYIFILLDTAEKIGISQKSRLGNRDYRTSLKSFAAMGSALMIRAVRRSQALYEAMEARCYDGRIRVLRQKTEVLKRDLIWLILFETLLAILSFGRLLP